MASSVHVEDTLQHKFNFFLGSLVKNFSDEGLNFSGVEQMVVVLVVEIVQSSKEPPEQASESAVVVFGLYNRFRLFHWLQWFEQILLDELEILHVGDVTISVFVGFLEYDCCLNGVDNDLKETVGIVEKFNKLLAVHLSLSTKLHLFGSVSSLERDLSTVSFQQKVSLSYPQTLRTQGSRQSHYRQCPI